MLPPPKGKPKAYKSGAPTDLSAYLNNASNLSDVNGQNLQNLLSSPAMLGVGQPNSRIDEETRKGLMYLFSVDTKTPASATDAVLKDDVLVEIFALLPDQEILLDNGATEEAVIRYENENKIIAKGLDVLLRLSMNIFVDEISEDYQRKCQDALRNVENDGYERLLEYHSTYVTPLFKQKVAVILGRFHCGLIFSDQYHILFQTYIEALSTTHGFTLHPNQDLSSTLKDEFDIIYCTLCALVSISSLTDNESYIIDGQIIPAVYPKMTHHDFYIIKRASLLLKNICTTSDTDNVKKIIDTNIFSFFNEILTQLLSADNEPSSTQNYLLIVEDMVKTISFLVSNQQIAVGSLLSCKIVPLLFTLLHSTTAILISPPASSIPEQQQTLLASSREIQLDILRTFMWCTYFTADQTASFVEYEAIPALVSVLDQFNAQVEKLQKDKEEGIEDPNRGEVMREEVVLVTIKVFNNISNFGSTKPLEDGRNSYREQFEEAMAPECLFQLFTFLVAIPEDVVTPMLQEALYKVSLTMARIYKAAKPPLDYGRLLEYLADLKSQPPPASGYNYPKNAGIIWNKMSDAQDVLDQYEKFSKEVESLDKKVGKAAGDL